LSSCSSLNIELDLSIVLGILNCVLKTLFHSLNWIYHNAHITLFSVVAVALTVCYEVMKSCPKLDTSMPRHLAGVSPTFNSKMAVLGIRIDCVCAATVLQCASLFKMYNPKPVAHG
jgi:hypothetical protein